MQALAELLITRWSMTMLRALLILGPLALIFWVWKPEWLQRFRIHQPRVAPTKTREELPRTIISLSLYIIPIAVIYLTGTLLGHSMAYTDIAQYGYAYFFLQILLFGLIVDTWFYWTHRLMHAQKFFIRAHNIHHRSYNPTPASSYSFGIVEGLINVSPYMIMLLILPWHPLALFIYGTLGIGWIGYLHLGYDFGYEFRKKHPVLKWIYSSTHHSVHHQLYDGNFGVYFTFWDKLMGTEKEIIATPVGKPVVTSHSSAPSTRPDTFAPQSLDHSTP